MNTSADLNSYQRNVTSQWGEDGIIDEIFRRIGTQTKLCVEFGAWDGKHLSNTWDLWHNRAWTAILIEGDSSKFDDLAASVSAFPNVVPHCAYVATSGENRLDQILDRLGVTQVIDLLSVDIDGDDRGVFESLEKHLPRLLVIEYNPTIPPEIELVGVPGTRFGSSAKSLCTLAAKKGYRLVACTITNLFFVHHEDFASLGITEPELAAVMPRDHLTYVVTAYDGTTYLTRQPTYAQEFSSPERRDLMHMLLGRKSPPLPRTPAPDESVLPVSIHKVE